VQTGFFKTFAVVAVGSAILAACSGGVGSQSFSPSAAPMGGRAFSLKPGAVAQPDHSRSWMKSDAAGGALLYVTDAETYDVYVYSWPKLKAAGTLTGFNGPSGECSDKKGNVWIVNTYDSNVIEYAHGGTTPIATLDDAGQYPYSCAVDNAGDLAVGNIESTTGDAGSVTVYAGGTGSGINYPDSDVYVSFVGYKQNTLYVDGSNSGYVSLQSFKKGKFKTLTISGETINVAGGVEFAKNSLTIGDQLTEGGTPAIYQISASGKITGTTSLNSGACGQYAIDGKLVACPDASNKSVSVYDYPAGGSATQTLTGSFKDPFAAVISR
jgi:hypothetical protein